MEPILIVSQWRTNRGCSFWEQEVDNRSSLDIACTLFAIIVQAGCLRLSQNRILIEPTPEPKLIYSSINDSQRWLSQCSCQSMLWLWNRSKPNRRSTPPWPLHYWRFILALSWVKLCKNPHNKRQHPPTRRYTLPFIISKYKNLDQQLRLLSNYHHQQHQHHAVRIKKRPIQGIVQPAFGDGWRKALGTKGISSNDIRTQFTPHSQRNVFQSRLRRPTL